LWLLVFPAQNADVTVERVEFQLRPAVADADAEEIVARDGDG